MLEYRVKIPREYFRDFEEFLYAGLGYSSFGWTRFAEGDYQVYILELTSEQAMMITLRYEGAQALAFG